MVKSKQRGAVSLMSVLCLVGIVMVLAAAMVGVFSMNLNVTQKSFNGAIAEAEAEAGIAEALYRITLEDNVDNSHQPPTVSYGLSGETIRATITPSLAPSEAYHLVTFASGTEFPHSTNNTHLDRDLGSLGRTVPDGMFHLVSTGYCRGQYRTIECLVSKPPFPFGLATSGKLVSHEPFVVKGVSSMANLISGEEDRPGHLLCNSLEGVEIGQSDPPRPTYISGFVKSVGPISIAQPAQVLGGLRPGADASTLAKIDVTSFRNVGEPGVVTILDPTFVNEQRMDIMYFFSGDLLTYERSVTLNKAFLYVEGDLLIRGPVTGEGLIVVDGNVTFGSGTHLDGANKMAVLASGDVTIRGANNYFTGLVYCGGNFQASNVTVVGNTIVNSDDPEKGRADLENVTVIGNTETADMTISITSSSSAQGQNNAPDGVIPLGINSDTFGLPPDWDYSNGGGGGLGGWIDPADPQSMYVNILMEMWELSLENPAEFPALGMAPSGAGTGGIWAQAVALYDLAAANAVVSEQIDDLEGLLSGAPGNGHAVSDLQSQIQDLQDAQEASQTSYLSAANALVAAIYDHMESHADGDGVYDDGTVVMDIEQDRHFRLNEYLPESERVKIAYWKVHYNRP
jgi:hypothetical protein